jgi:hypothetical protein
MDTTYVCKSTNRGQRNMRDQLIETLGVHFSSHILKHKMNVEIMLKKPMAIHDHTDWMGALEKELEVIAEYEDKLEVLNKHFRTKA